MLNKSSQMNRVTFVLCFSSAQTVMRETAAKCGFVKHSEYPEKIFRFRSGSLDYELPQGFPASSTMIARPSTMSHWIPVCIMGSIMMASFGRRYGFPHAHARDATFQPSVAGHCRRMKALVHKPGTPTHLLKRSAHMPTWSHSCTQPKYRNMWIAAAIVAEMIRRVKPLGATYITGGSSDFYTTIGYEVSHNNECWVKRQEA